MEMKRAGSKDFSIASILADKLEPCSRSLTRSVRHIDLNQGKDFSLKTYLNQGDSTHHLNEKATQPRNCHLLPETVYDTCCAIVLAGDERKELAVGFKSPEADIRNVHRLGRKAERISLNYLECDSMMHSTATFLSTDMVREENVTGLNISRNSAMCAMRKESEKWKEGDARNHEGNQVSKPGVVRANCAYNRSKSGSNIGIMEILDETLVARSQNASLREARKSCTLAREDTPTMSNPSGNVSFRKVESNNRQPGSSYSFRTVISQEETTDESALAKITLSPRREKLDWLEYTRYRPPKIPRRVIIGREKRRKPSMHPRIPFSTPQLQFLEDKFQTNVYLTKNEATEIASTLRLPQSRVKIWFQNRRARARREKQTLRGSS